jgi:hypothetical protein
MVTVPQAPFQAPPSTERVRPAAPARPRRWVLGRRLWWLAGDVVIALTAVLLASFPWTSFQGESPGDNEWGLLLVMAGMSAFFVFVGLMLWQVVEYFHTPEGLLSAARGGAAGYARVCLTAGVPVDCRSDFGDTPLIKAAAAGHIDTVKLLLGHGADTALRNLAGQTARDAAWAAGRQDVVALLDAQRPSQIRPAAAVWRPAWGWRLPLVAATGVLIVLGIAFVCYPQPVAQAHFEEMLAAGEFFQVERRGDIVIGNRKELPLHLALFRLGEDRTKVWTRMEMRSMPQQELAMTLKKLKEKAPEVQWVDGTRYFGHPQALCPRWWEGPLIVLFAVGVVCLVGWPQLRLRFLYPYLAPARRSSPPAGSRQDDSTAAQ